MQSFIDYLKLWQPHPFVDHFTVALILLGIVTDLVASLFSTRLWLRYTALTLMIAGAIGAAGSNLTGGWEANRVWDSVSGPGKAVLERHAWWGDILPWVYGGLALWRLGSQFVGFIGVSRPIYLLAAIIGGALIVYQGHLGGVMVYDYGIGTALLPPSQATAPSPVPSAALATPEAMNTPAPVSPVPPSPTPSITPMTAPSPGPIPPTPAVGVSATPSEAAPSPAPSMGSSGPPINPPPSKSPTLSGGEGKNL